MTYPQSTTPGVPAPRADADLSRTDPGLFELRRAYRSWRVDRRDDGQLAAVHRWDRPDVGRAERTLIQTEVTAATTEKMAARLHTQQALRAGQQRTPGSVTR